MITKHTRFHDIHVLELLLVSIMDGQTNICNSSDRLGSVDKQCLLCIFDYLGNFRFDGGPLKQNKNLLLLITVTVVSLHVAKALMVTIPFID